MKRKHDPEKWDGSGFRAEWKDRTPYKHWHAKREAMFDEPRKVLLTMQRVSANNADGDVADFADYFHGQWCTSYIGIKLKDGKCATWSPERGYRVRDISSSKALADRFFDIPSFGSVAAQLATVTRRAFMPSAFVQLYKTSPTLLWMVPPP